MKSILDYIKVFKNIETYQDPRSMALGPRNTYQDGQLVTPSVDGSRPGYSGDTTTRNKIIKFLKGKKEIRSTELREFLDKKGFTGQRAADMQHKKWFKDLNIKYIQDPNPMLTGEKRGRANIPKSRKTVYNKYAALFHKEQPKTFLSPDWDKLTYDQRQDISTIAKSNDYKFKVNYSRRKRFNPTKEKKLIDVFELTEQNFLDHGKYGVKKTLANGKTNPEYTKIFNYTQNDFKFPKKDLLPVKMQRQVMNTFDLPEGVTEWKFDEYKYGVPDTQGKNMNLGKRIANSLRENKSWKISTDWSKPNGWMMHAMNRAFQNDMRLPNGKLAYEPKYEMIDGNRKIIGFTDNTPAGKSKTYYGLKKWNKKYKGTDWDNHADFKKTSKFVDITKKAYAQPNEVIMGLLEKGGIPRDGKLQLNHVLKFLAQQEGYDIERLKNAIVKHHMGGVGAGKVIGNPTNDIQILKVTTNNEIRNIENKIRRGIYLKDDITTLKNYGASVRGLDGKLYGGGSKTAIGGFKAIEKGAEQAIKKWEPKDFNKFKTHLEKAFKERGIKLKKGQAGYIATDLVKDIGKLGPKGLRLLSSEWVWPEIVIGWLDKQNNIQKGMSPERASSEMWKNVTFGLRDKGGTENAILGQAKELGYGEKDIAALENVMKYGKVSKKIEDTKKGIETVEKGYTPFTSEDMGEDLKEKLKNLKKEQESVGELYFGALGDKDAMYGFDIYDQASKELMRKEWNKSLEGRKKRTDPYAGEIGSQTKELLGMTPNWYETKELIKHMSPQELDKWNLQERGIGYERVHPMYGAAMSDKQMESLRDQMGYMHSDGGRAGYMGGGIAAIRKPSEIPPERQGLRSIMINAKDD